MRTLHALLLVLAAAPAGAAGAGSRVLLVPGQHVKVEGRTRPDGVFQVEQIAIRDSATTAKIEGSIAEASPDHRRLRMLGFDVIVDRATRLFRGTQPSNARGMLAKGAWIEAKGTWRDGVLRATRVRVKDAPETTEEIEGFIEAADSDGLVLLGRRVVFPADVPIADERTGDAAAATPDRLRRDDDDAQARQPLQLGNVVFGGRIEGGYLDEQNFDTDEPEADRAVLSRVQLLASAQITESIEAYTKLTMSRNVTIGSGVNASTEVAEAYVMAHRIAGLPVDVQVGRQRFRDAREWFFDEYLDGARVHVTLPAWKLEAAVTRGLGAGPVETRRRQDQLQFIASASTRVAGALQVSGYAITRDDVTRREKPAWFGATVRGDAGRGVTFWSDAAIRRGSAGATTLRGWAIDSGATRRWMVRWSPSVTLGYAAGSGDDRRSDGVDTRFRQTDLEDNQAYYGGLRRLAIYGELFDAELTNLHVLTAGLGARPTAAMSIDVIYHHYRQAVATSSLPSGNLDGRLHGASRALGQEVNAVLTIRAIPGLDIDLASGVFVPGAAFDAATKPAFFWRPQVRFYF